jgi:Spy/CpxP family protein refolding chaperone
LTKLFSDREKQQAKHFRDFPDRLLEVLTPQQREKLLEGIDVEAPRVYVPPLRDASSQQFNYTLSGPNAAPSFIFLFNSPSDACVDVYAESSLSDAATRKQLRLSDAQEAKLRAIHAAAQTAADGLFKTYDLDYEALKKLPPEAQQKKRGEYEARRDEYRRKLTDFAVDNRRQIEAVLDGEQLAAIRKTIRTTRAVMALMSRDRKTRDSISATGRQRAKMLELEDEQRDPSRFQRQTGEDALKVLTPEQRQKLVEDVERGGG